MGLTARLPAAAAAWVLLGTCVQLPAAGAADAVGSAALPAAPQADPALGFAFEGQMIQGGAVIGNAVIGGPVATIAGGVGGALLGRHLDKKHTRARNGCRR